MQTPPSFTLGYSEIEGAIICAPKESWIVKLLREDGHSSTQRSFGMTGEKLI